MLNSQRPASWGSGQPQTQGTPALNNPFTAQSTQHPVNPFAQVAQANPFLQKQSNGAALTPNPFLANPFASSASTQQSRSASPFEQPQNPPAPHNPFAAKASFGDKPNFGKPRFGQPSNSQAFKPTVDKNSNKASSAPNPFSKQTSGFSNGSANKATTDSNANGKRKVSEYVQPAWPKQEPHEGRAQTNGKRKSEKDFQRPSKFSRQSPDPEAASIRSRPPVQDDKLDYTNMLSKTREESEVFAKKIMDQLAKDNINPPRWPENPGSFSQRQAIENLRESHKAYRDRARKSLMRAGLIDDPDKKRRLDEALIFKGICEEMCPEWEQITRIVEHDIRGPEKKKDDAGELVADPQIMVKRLARSAAGQDAPLPMDVRSVRALLRTLLYLFDLIKSDDMLPQKHSFLWDRTRAIRIDFSFQKYAMTRDEIMDQVLCLELITRFHVTSLHLLSRDGFTPSDFSEQQEIEQLSKTLITLMEVYDDCEHQRIQCPNEPEFRGYFIVFNAFNTGVSERIEDLQRRFGHARGIKSAIGLTECIKNIRSLHISSLPGDNSTIAANSISIFFELVKQPIVSYTLACFAEIHFNTVRKAILKVIRTSFKRPKFGPKDLTPAVLKGHLYIDTEDEAVSFFSKHGFEFDTTDGFAIVSPGHQYIDARISHPYSESIVERKRMGHSFQDVIHSTVYEEDALATGIPTPAGAGYDDWEDENLFVDGSGDVSFTGSNGQEDSDDWEGRDSEGYETGVKNDAPTPPSSRPASMSPQPAPMFGNYAVTKPNSSSQPAQSPDSSVQSGSNVGFLQSSPFGGVLPKEQSPASLMMEAEKATGAEDAHLVPFMKHQPAPVTANTNPTVSLPSVAPKAAPPQDFSHLSAEEEKQGQEQNKKKNFESQASSSTAKKVRFSDDSSQDTPDRSTTLTTTPPTSSLFSFLNKKEDNKDASTPASTPGPSPFSGLQSNSSATWDKDGNRQAQCFGMSATPGPWPSNNATPFSSITTSSTTPSMFPTLAKPQFESTSHAEKSSTIASPGSSLFQPRSTESPAAPAPTIPAPTQSNTLPKQSPVAASSILPPQGNGSAQGQTSGQATLRDPMDSFTRWFVCGDKGLMESHLQEAAVEMVLKGVFEDFQKNEKERAQKEEEERDLAKALKFREESLRVKFFYRWHEGFRKRQRIARMKMEREKAIAWYLPENMAKREKEARERKKQERNRLVQEAQDSMVTNSTSQKRRRKVEEAAKLQKQQELEDARRFRSALQGIEGIVIPPSQSSQTSQASRESSSFGSRLADIEQALLATGVFKGVRDEKAAAKDAAWGDGASRKEALEKEARLRAENKRRVARGLSRLRELPEPPKVKEGAKTAMLRARLNGTGRDTMSLSTGDLRESTFSSSYRSSLGYNNHRVTKPRTIRATDPYWRMKASGFVKMPNGEYLPESVAHPILQGETRFGNYGVPAAQPSTPGQSPLPVPDGYFSSPIRSDRGSAASSPPSASNSQKRKRHDEAVLNGNEASPSTKRARTGEQAEEQQLTNADDHLANIAKFLNQVNNRVESVKTSTPKGSPTRF